MGLIVTMCCCVHGRRGRRGNAGWLGGRGLIFKNTCDSKPVTIADSPLEIATRLRMDEAFPF